MFAAQNIDIFRNFKFDLAVVFACVLPIACVLYTYNTIGALNKNHLKKKRHKNRRRFFFCFGTM